MITTMKRTLSTAICICIYLTTVQCQGNGDATDDELLASLLGLDPCTCVDQLQCKTKEPTVVTPDVTPEPEEPDFLDIIKPKSGCPGEFDVCCLPGDIIGGTFGIIGDLLPGTNKFCGFVNVTLFTKTFGSTYAQEGEFPWFAAITRNGLYECPGSLIHPRFVLTTAHRMKEITNTGELMVRMGDAHLGTTPPLVEVGVQEIIVHPKFNPKRLYYDVALLILDSEVFLGLGVSTMCLPNVNQDYTSNCLSGGWATDPSAEEVQESGQERLKKVNLPLWDNFDCQTTLRGTELTQRFNLDESFICAGGETQDTCEGDGGSPLVCPLIGGEPDQYVQVGVTSWGLGCGLEGVPGVYAATVIVMDWIRETIDLNVYGADAHQYFSL